MSSGQLPRFELIVPQDLKEAVDFLDAHGKAVAIMAGGTDLLVQLKGGYKADYVLTLSEIPGLDYINYDPPDGLRIGAMATMAQVVDNDIIKKHYVALWQSAAQNGTPQTRNAATVMGNLLRASPSGDCCCAILAHGGKVILEGPNGRRSVDMDEFWVSYMVTARQPNEIAVEVLLPAIKESTVSSFSALNRTKQDLSKISAAVSLSMDGKTCKKARIAMGAIAPIPLKMRMTERILDNVEITDEVLDKAGKTASEEIKPIDDIRSTAEYRRMVAGTLLRRTIESAIHSH